MGWVSGNALDIAHVNVPGVGLERILLFVIRIDT